MAKQGNTKGGQLFDWRVCHTRDPGRKGSVEMSQGREMERMEGAQSELDHQPWAHLTLSRL